MGRKGKSTKLYIATNIETPVHLEVKRSGDIGVDFDKDSEEYSMRGEDFAYNATGVKKAPITFKFLRKPKPALTGQETAAPDAVYVALMDSFANSTPLLTTVLDGPIATVGSTGWRGAYEVKKMTLAAPVNGVEAWDVEMLPVEASYMNADTLVEVTVAPITISA